MGVTIKYVLLIILGIIIGAYALRITCLRLPFIILTNEWSIGIYKGKSPVNLSSTTEIRNPVLTRKDVSDIPARFVADPFMIYENSIWYMFFEVKNNSLNKGEIGVATSNNGCKWSYKQIVLCEPFHVAYPYVFKWNDDYFMLPDCSKNYTVRLYKAIDFPYNWALDRVLLTGPYADPSILHFNNKWWLFAVDLSSDESDLNLFYTENFKDPWRIHPKSPIVKGNKSLARPGGRIVKSEDNKIIRYAQDNRISYGKEIKALEIIILTDEDYAEKEIICHPVLGPSGKGWNANGMHNVDPHYINNNQWIACVDGRRKTLRYRTS